MRTIDRLHGEEVADRLFSVHGFYRFVGVAQWLAAGLLLVPRTATLGAFLYLPIITNIFVITVGI